MDKILIADAYSRENAHKVGFLVNEFPDKKLSELEVVDGHKKDVGIFSLFSLPALDFTVASWRAQDMGFFTVDDKKTTTFHELPANWIFGADVDRLMAAIVYALGKLAETEDDINEETLSAWAVGYPPHDYLIAMRHLMNEGVIVEYRVENTTVLEASKKKKGKGKKDEIVKDVYTYYTLAENKGKEWGLKDFEDQSRVRVIENS